MLLLASFARFFSRQHLPPLTAHAAFAHTHTDLLPWSYLCPAVAAAIDHMDATLSKAVLTQVLPGALPAIVAAFY